MKFIEKFRENFRKNKGKKSERETVDPSKIKPSCVKVSKECAYDGDRVLKPKKECFSLIERDFSLRISDKPQGYAVKDVNSSKWISWVPRKTNDIPLFPYILEFAKSRLATNVAVVFLLDTPCGYIRVKVSPSIPEVKEKINVVVVKKNGDENPQRKILKVFQIREITDSFGRATPFLTITNKEEIKELLLQEIETAPRPPEIKEKIKKTALENIIVTDRPFLYAVASVKGSPELFIPKRLPTKAIAAGVLAVLIAFGGVHTYMKKKEEEEARRRMLLMQQQQKWTPSLVFKKNHIAYMFMPTSEDLRKLIKALYPPNGFRLVEASMSLSNFEITYETPYLVSGGERKGEIFVLKKSLKRTPKPSWESLRGKRPLVLPPFKEVVKRYADEVRKIGKDSIDGVLLASAEVQVEKKLTPKELKDELYKASKTPFEIESISLRLNKDTGIYAFSLKGKIYGLEEKDEK